MPRPYESPDGRFGLKSVSLQLAATLLETIVLPHDII